MNDKIKEILDKLQLINNCEFNFTYTIIQKSEAKALLDYITNLQKENEFLKLNNPEMNIEHFRIIKENKRKIDNLRKENERLKKENIKLYKKDAKIINELKEELEITQKKWNKDKQWSECRTKEWLDYKSRCEKAIEYIKNFKYGMPYTEWVKKEELLNILNGGSDE